MVAYIPAPELCQYADEDLLIEMGAIIFPGFVARRPRGNGLRLRLEGDYTDESLLQTAADRFQILLGALRAWRPLAGQRVDEVRPGIGPGSIRSEHGNQIVNIQPAIEYIKFDSEIKEYANAAKLALERSSHLRNAL